MFRFILALVASLSLATLVYADLKMTDIADQCADTAGFNTCWGNAVNEAELCYTHNCEGEGTCVNENDCTSSDPNCVQICSCIAYQAWIQCALESCWNMVRSCEYQNLAISASMYCPLALGNNDRNPFQGSGTGWVYIPYFPSNSTAPGACSCNIGLTYLMQRDAMNTHTSCENSCDSANQEGACDSVCDCCLGSATVSAFYDNCPDTDPAAVLGDMPQFNLARFEQSQGCNSILSSADCVSSGYAYGFSNGQTFLTPDTVPSNGTNDLSDSTDSITAPVYETITWALGASLSAQTAVAVTTGSSGSGSGGGGSPGNSGHGSGSGSGAGSSSGSSSSSPQSSTTSTPSSGSGTATASASSASKTSGAERTRIYSVNSCAALVVAVFAAAVLSL